MGEAVNVYCDESCHLEHDHQPVMVLGAVWCLEEKARSITERLREIKVHHGLNPRLEIKWTSVSMSKVNFFQDILDYFFDDNDLHFRALIAPKGTLRHEQHAQTHDDWYYKMYFNMLKIIIDPHFRYHIYLDYKDTWGRVKVAKLKEVLANAQYVFSRQIIERIQTVRSHEVELIQLADLLTGIISYKNRDLSGNAGKVQLVGRMQERSRKLLTHTTLVREDKVNLFKWRPAEADQ
jgi:hypothetical protein